MGKMGDIESIENTESTESINDTYGIGNMNGMKKKIIFYFSAICLIIVCMLLPAYKAGNGSPKLSNMSEEECLKWVNDQGLTIPNSFSDGNPGKFAKETICTFEAEPKTQSPYSSITATEVFTRIGMAVNDYYGVKYEKYNELEEWSTLQP